MTLQFHDKKRSYTSGYDALSRVPWLGRDVILITETPIKIKEMEKYLS
jgi:hypothetical protein